jgi:hypothetical protein
MNKTLAVAVLLLGVLAISFATNNPTSGFKYFGGPRIVAKVKLTNRTASVPDSILFTPTQSGLYRISVYMSMTAPASGGAWQTSLSWTDDAGAEQLGAIAGIYNSAVPPTDYSTDGREGTPNLNPTIWAVAGAPVTYSVTGIGTVGGAYEMFMVAEQLE